MRFGCEVNISAQDAPFLYARGGPYKLVASAGFDTTDLSWDSYVTAALTGQDALDALEGAPALAQAVRSAGLELVCYHSDLLAPERDPAENAALQEEHMHRARALGCNLFLIHSLWENWQPFNLSSAREWQRYLNFDIRNLKEIGSRCSAQGLRLVVENNPSFPLAYYAELFNEIPAQSAGMCLDVGHANIQLTEHRAPLSDWIVSLGDRIEHLHLHGNDGVKDVHLPILAPGGTVDWSACCRALKTVRYAGVLHEELPPMTGPDLIRWALCTRGSAPIRNLWERESHQ